VNVLIARPLVQLDALAPLWRTLYRVPPLRPSIARNLVLSLLQYVKPQRHQIVCAEPRNTLAPQWLLVLVKPTQKEFARGKIPNAPSQQLAGSLLTSPPRLQLAEMLLSNVSLLPQSKPQLALLPMPPRLDASGPTLALLSLPLQPVPSLQVLLELRCAVTSLTLALTQLLLELAQPPMACAFGMEFDALPNALGTVICVELFFVLHVLPLQLLRLDSV